TYQGEPVQSRRTDDALREIAERTGGAFIPLGLASADLGSLYRDRIEPVALARRVSLRVSDRAERFGLGLLAALVLGLVASRPRGLLRPTGRREVVLATTAL